uniref:Uncharacterized protein n=1 Tax=Anguilla anguilla TaxID=7936 RepID=A0A0E9W2F0_ANGAN
MDDRRLKLFWTNSLTPWNPRQNRNSVYQSQRLPAFIEFRSSSFLSGQHF